MKVKNNISVYLLMTVMQRQSIYPTLISWRLHLLGSPHLYGDIPANIKEYVAFEQMLTTAY